MKIKIRKATNKDVDKIREIQRNAGYKSHLQKIEKITRPERVYFIAEKDNNIRGYLAAWSLKIGDLYTAQIDDLLIVQGSRRHGFGEKLVRTFLKFCREKGINQVTLDVGKNNKQAIDCYKKCGFLKDSSLLCLYINL